MTAFGYPEVHCACCSRNMVPIAAGMDMRPRRPHVCPVCKGKGAVDAGFYGGSNETCCRACRGTGVIIA